MFFYLNLDVDRYNRILLLIGIISKTPFNVKAILIVSWDKTWYNENSSIHIWKWLIISKWFV